MGKWLMKTEPEDYSWDRLVADGETEWSGVRSHQAARNMRAMAEGDPVFFYRSVVDPAIVGIMRVSRTWYPDPDDETGKFVRVCVRPDRPFARPVTLKEIKAAASFADFALVRQSRLSVMPVSDRHWGRLCAMGGIEA